MRILTLAAAAAAVPVLTIALVSLPPAAQARTKAECNSIYNSCSKLCDKYGATTNIIVSCIQNCGAKAQQCHNTASDAAAPATSVSDGGGTPPKKPRVPVMAPAGLLDASPGMAPGGPAPTGGAAPAGPTGPVLR
jgi:hypothetical protein